MPQKKLLLAAATSAALLTLGACQKEPEVINAGPRDPQEEALKKATPVALPPSIAASRTYRCKDNSLIQVDFMSDNTTAVLRAPKDGNPVTLKAPEAGQPFAGGEASVTGSGTIITVKAPGKGAQECKA